jgi:hypothetical protein
MSCSISWLLAVSGFVSKKWYSSNHNIWYSSNHQRTFQIEFMRVDHAMCVGFLRLRLCVVCFRGLQSVAPAPTSARFIPKRFRPPSNNSHAMSVVIDASTAIAWSVSE